MAFKVFTSATISAAEVNDYLMEQTMIQCTSGTRPGSPAEGWHIYETDTDKVYVRNGSSAWVEVLRLGAWESDTVTPTSWVSGTNIASRRWCRIAGRTIAFSIVITNGATGWPSTTPTVGLPITPALTLPGAFNVCIRDNSTGGLFLGTHAFSSGTDIDLYAFSASGTYPTTTALSSTVPFTWAVDDTITITGVYEAAAST